MNFGMEVSFKNKYASDLSLIKMVAPNVSTDQLLKFIDILLEK